MKYFFKKALQKASPHAKALLDEYHHLSEKQRGKYPPLYWILGTGTPPFKFDKKDVDYKPAEGKETCGNCHYAYQKVITKKYICSWVSGKIRPEDWCNRWKP